MHWSGEISRIYCLVWKKRNRALCIIHCPQWEMKQYIYPVFCLYIKSAEVYTRNDSHWRWGSREVRLLPFHAFWIFNGANALPIKNASEMFCNSVSSADVYTGFFFFFMIYAGVTIKIASNQTVAWFGQQTIRRAAGVNQDLMGWPQVTNQKPY